MYRQLQKRLIAEVEKFLRERYSVELPRIAVDQPPRVELGEYALPLAFELARQLRKPPKKIAEEIAAGLGEIPGFHKLEVAGAGYLNARLKRADAAALLVRADTACAQQETSGRVLVEHTSINPNKAAHIGHLRNAIMGDTFVRLLRCQGHPVVVQNYIDNTGAQVADVVVGFMHLAKKSKPEIEALIAATHPPFDYYCWDLYAQVSQWYSEDKENLAHRGRTLHEIEQGNNPTAEIADLISTAVLRRHLETMQRLGIIYDFLPRESEILHLKFWELAFDQMKQKGVLYLETKGKNAGCWVMPRSATPAASAPAADDSAEAAVDEDAKIIVRSNGTVGYVGKDIAYHMWKFGVLGRDFGYRPFYAYPNMPEAPEGHDVWISTEHGVPDHPQFAGVSAIYNVIDARQSDPQNNVIEALRALGYAQQAAHYTHFSYEMVALTPRCAAEMGYTLSDEEAGKAYIEVSGRKGFGVKADDLIDRLITSAQAEVDSRHPELPQGERRQIAEQIAIGALRYFMLKFTKNSVIAFDFKEALSFEGETGPYVQYAVVRAANIFRKNGSTPQDALSAGAKIDFSFLDGDSEAGNQIWELWLTASQLSYVVEQTIATTEPAYIAKFAFQLAQQFNNFYHRHNILREPDEARKNFLLATAAVVARELTLALGLMGITVPAVM